MSCQAAGVYAALLLQLFPNALMGGRIAAAFIASGSVAIGAGLGGAAVHAAWAAAGSGSASLVRAVKETLAGPPSPAKSAILAKIAAGQNAAAGAAAGAAVAKPKPTLGEAAAFLTELPIVGASYYAVLCVAAVVMLGLFSVVRCDPKNKAAGGLGTILALVAGLVIANAGAVPVVGIMAFWKSVVLDLIRMGLVASAAVLLSGVLVLPSTASDAALRTLADALEGVGQCMSGYGAGGPGAAESRPGTAASGAQTARSRPRLLPRSDAHAAAAASLRRAVARGRSAALDAESDKAVLQRLRSDTEPAAARAPGSSHHRPAPAGDDDAPPVTAWRALLARAATELAEASFEPPCLFAGRGPFRGARWRAVVAAADALIGRCAALEELVQWEDGCARAAAADAAASAGGRDVAAAFRAAAAAAATGVAVLSRALRDPRAAPTLWAASPPGLHGAGWDALQERLVRAAHAVQTGYWARLTAPGDAAAADATSHESMLNMRALHHAAMLAGGVVEAVEGLEAAVARALDLPTVAADKVAAVKPGDDEVHDAIEAAKADMDAALGPGETPQPPGKGGEVAPTAPPPLAKEPNPWAMWAITLIAGLSGLLVWARLAKAAAGTARAVAAAARGRSVPPAAAPSPKAVQFGVKYWIGTSACLCACIIALWQFPAVLYDWQASGVFTVVAVCLQPMAEETGWRASVQAVFTLAGGAVGYAVMASPSVASSAPAVVALLLLVVFAGGHMHAVGPLKEPLFLGLSVYMSTLLCQYPRPASKVGRRRGRGEGGVARPFSSPSSPRPPSCLQTYLAGKVLSTAIGSLVTLAVGAAIFPRKASTDCLEKLGDALVAGAALLDTAWGAFGKGVDADSIAEFKRRLLTEVDAPLAAVHAALRVGAAPVSLPCAVAARDLVSPMPPAVHAMADAVGAVSRRLAALGLAASQEWRAGESGALRAWAASQPLAGEAARLWTGAVDGEVREALAATSRLAAAARGSLRAARSRALVDRARASVEAAVADTETARVRMAHATRAALPAVVEAAVQGR